MSTPVSVLIPAYNRADLLPETLDSILAQTYPPAEVIVVDDGSKDNTREAVARFSDRVRYHFTENGGICLARNTAASLASSPYIAFCDHDDLWRDDKLAQQMSLHDRNPGLAYSFTNFSLVVEGVWAARTKLDDAPPTFFAPPLPPGRTPIEYTHSLYDQLLTFQPIWPSTIVLARDFFHRIGGFRNELGKNPSEDLDFTLRCVEHGPIGVVREPVVGVRRHSLNYSGDNYRNTIGQLEVLDYALHHHPISDATRSLIREQIDLRRVEASYGAFRAGDFNQVVSLLSGVPPSQLDSKTRLKLGISRLPLPLAKGARKFLMKN